MRGSRHRTSRHLGAAWRLLRGQIGGPWPRLVAQGVVAICLPVESELMVCVRAGRDFEPFTAVLRRTFVWVPALDDPWRQLLAVQRDLIKIGHHRRPSPMDLIIALTAEAHGLTDQPRIDQDRAVTHCR